MKVPLHERIFFPESMDAPSAEPHKLERSYAQLALINRSFSRMHGLLSRYVLAPTARREGTSTVLEAGCGGGDVLLWFARQARRRGITLQLIGLDADPRAVARARQTLAGFPEASVQQGSIADLGASGPSADYVFCNHVLHHVPPAEIASALRSLRRAARRSLLVNDLERSPLAYALFSGLAAAAFRDSFVYDDGRLSIRKGFRLRELAAACKQAGFPAQTRIFRLFPWRLVIAAPGGET